jgi:hypothetical protein
MSTTCLSIEYIRLEKSSVSLVYLSAEYICLSSMSVKYFCLRSRSAHRPFISVSAVGPSVE